MVRVIRVFSRESVKAFKRIKNKVELNYLLFFGNICVYFVQLHHAFSSYSEVYCYSGRKREKEKEEITTCHCIIIMVSFIWTS